MPVTGNNCKLYRNTGTYASPTWVEINEIGDLNVTDLARTMAELKRRSSSFTVTLAALIQTISIEFKLWHGLGATVFTALRTMFFAGTSEEWLVADANVATTGTQGLRLGVLLEQFPWDQNLEDVSGHDVVAKAAYFESPAGTVRDPSWHTTP